MQQLYELLWRAPFPAPGETVVLSVGERAVSYSRPGTDDLPLADVRQ